MHRTQVSRISLLHRNGRERECRHVCFELIPLIHDEVVVCRIACRIETELRGNMPGNGFESVYLNRLVTKCKVSDL